MYFGTYIKNERILKGKSQKDIAKALGIKRQSISRWETNRSYPSLEHLYALSDCLDVSVEDILVYLRYSLTRQKG